MAVAVFIRKASGFPPSIEQKFVDKTTFGDTEIFNAQLVAALPDGCSSLHQEGVAKGGEVPKKKASVLPVALKHEGLRAARGCHGQRG